MTRRTARTLPHLPPGTLPGGTQGSTQGRLWKWSLALWLAVSRSIVTSCYFKCGTQSMHFNDVSLLRHQHIVTLVGSRISRSASTNQRGRVTLIRRSTVHRVACPVVLFGRPSAWLFRDPQQWSPTWTVCRRNETKNKRARPCYLLGTRTLLGAPGLTSSSKDATRGSWPY